jgi:hypothetical protein
MTDTTPRRWHHDKDGRPPSRLWWSAAAASVAAAAAALSVVLPAAAADPPAAEPAEVVGVQLVVRSADPRCRVVVLHLHTGRTECVPPLYGDDRRTPTQKETS